MYSSNSHVGGFALNMNEPYPGHRQGHARVGLPIARAVESLPNSPAYGWHPQLVMNQPNSHASEYFNEIHNSLLPPVATVEYTEENRSALLKAIKPKALDNAKDDLPPPSYDSATILYSAQLTEMPKPVSVDQRQIDPNMMHFGVLGQRLSPHPPVSATTDSKIALTDKEIAVYKDMNKKEAIQYLVAAFESSDSNESTLWLDFVREHIWGTMTLEEIE